VSKAKSSQLKSLNYKTTFSKSENNVFQVRKKRFPSQKTMPFMSGTTVGREGVFGILAKTFGGMG
jgi:hypothetical protein